MISFEDALTNSKIEFCFDLALSARSSFRIGGLARYAAFPKDAAELAALLSLAHDFKVPFAVLGNCSNMLFDDDGFGGMLIFTERMNRFCLDGTRLECDCGVMLAKLSIEAANRGLSGLEFACGIPGSVGGAVYMNAGAYGRDISAILLESTVMDLTDGSLHRWDRESHAFGYRYSALQSSHTVCLSSVFRLVQSDPDAIRQWMDQNRKSRREKQPMEFPNAGSYFKRPAGYFAGKLIEDCGLKGARIGGAMVSVKHAGFIINCGGATCRDVLALEDMIRERVWKEFGVMLEREVRVFPNGKGE